MKVPENDQLEILNTLISSLFEEINSVLSFKGKWSIIAAKLADLHNRLPFFSSNHPLHHDLLLSVDATLIDAAPLAKRCQVATPCEGKLRTQSDLDSITAKLDAHIKDAEILVCSGALQDEADVSSVISTTGSKREAVRTESRNLITRLQIGAQESKNSAMDSLLELLDDDDKNVLNAVAQGVVPVLVRSLDSCCAEMKEKAVSAISRISMVENCKHLLITTDGLFLLNHLLRILESGNGFTKEKACVSLRALTFSKENAMAVGSRGGISSLLEICRSGTPGSQAIAAGVLLNLSVFHEIRANFMEENAIPVLLALSGAGTTKARENAIGCLSNLVFDDVDLKLRIAREGAIDCLKTFWDEAPAVQTLDVAIELLRTLASSSSPVIAELVLSGGFIPRLVYVLNCGVLSVRIAAANAIFELGFSAKATKEMGECGCIPHLTSMLDGKGIEEKEAAAKALSTLLVYAGNRKIFQAEGGIMGMVQLLDPLQNLDKRYPVSVLASLVHSKKCRKQMVDAGASLHLQKLADMKVNGARKLLESLNHGRNIWSSFIRP